MRPGGCTYLEFFLLETLALPTPADRVSVDAFRRCLARLRLSRLAPRAVLHRPGRPAVPPDVRALIRTMSEANARHHRALRQRRANGEGGRRARDGRRRGLRRHRPRFSAYDDTTGRERWHTGLNDVPNSAPILLRSPRYLKSQSALPCLVQTTPQITCFWPLSNETQSTTWLGAVNKQDLQLTRMNQVVPLAMKAPRREVERRHLVSGNASSNGISAPIEATADRQAFGGRTGDSASAGSRGPQDDSAVSERDGRGTAEDDAAEAVEPEIANESQASDSSRRARRAQTAKTRSE